MDRETRKALNELARHKMKHRLLADVLFDMNVCKLEGWDYKQYVQELKNELDAIVKKFGD